MGLRESAEYYAWRESRSVELIGPYATKTAGCFVSSTQRRTSDGWLYCGRDAFCFFADNPIELAYLSPPGRLDQRTLVIAFQDCSTPQIQSIPFGPNLIVDFGGGREFAGAKDRMEQVVRLWQMWASGSEDPNLWKEAADVSALPLYSRPVRLPSRPAHTATGAMLGVLASIAGVSSSATGTLQMGWLGGLVLVASAAAVLLVVGRFLPHVVSGFALTAIAGSVISSIVSFSNGYTTSGFVWLLMAVTLVVVRVWIPRFAPKTKLF